MLISHWQVINCSNGVGLQLFIWMENQQGINIFFEEKHTETLNEHNCKEEPLPESLPYLQRGDSSKYLDQFLVKNQEPPQPQPQPQPPQPPEKEQSNSLDMDEDFSLSDRVKFTPSAFHNFQKHLTVSLKHSIEIKPQEKVHKEYQLAGARLWKVFKQSNFSTKKILHFLLGEQNEHKVTEGGLKEYGLLKVYEEYGEEVMREARNYLGKETLRQIQEGKLEEYIEAKKLKDKEKFRRYVGIFVEELEQGFLRKRLPKDKVYELQH